MHFEVERRPTTRHLTSVLIAGEDEPTRRRRYRASGALAILVVNDDRIALCAFDRRRVELDRYATAVLPATLAVGTQTHVNHACGLRIAALCTISIANTCVTSSATAASCSRTTARKKGPRHRRNELLVIELRVRLVVEHRA